MTTEFSISIPRKLESNTSELAELILLAQSGDVNAMLRLASLEEILHVDNLPMKLAESPEPQTKPNLNDSE